MKQHQKWFVMWRSESKKISIAVIKILLLSLTKMLHICKMSLDCHWSQKKLKTMFSKNGVPWPKVICHDFVFSNIWIYALSNSKPTIFTDYNIYLLIYTFTTQFVIPSKLYVLFYPWLAGPDCICVCSQWQQIC